MSATVMFNFLFGIALLYREFKKHKNDFMVKAIMSLLSSSKVANFAEQAMTKQSPAVNHLKAKRTVSKTIELKYEYGGTEYDLILPAHGKRKKWVKCTAITADASEIDVTVIVRGKAGPYGDFFGVKLNPNQVIRDAITLQFHDKKGKLLDVL
ncbi:MAG: hypothetical protein ACMG6E_03810 [Candidatus Roizmanbacteria bacterium]